MDRIQQILAQAVGRIGKVVIAIILLGVAVQKVSATGHENTETMHGGAQVAKDPSGQVNP